MKKLFIPVAILLALSSCRSVYVTNKSAKDQIPVQVIGSSTLPVNLQNTDAIKVEVSNFPAPVPTPTPIPTPSIEFPDHFTKLVNFNQFGPKFSIGKKYVITNVSVSAGSPCTLHLKRGNITMTYNFPEKEHREVMIVVEASDDVTLVSPTGNSAVVSISGKM